ncbi:hypothetical protein KY363_06245 [Candidatus Woesearchaeota archaeon]|nr:hypothetical protein [Candidatus Woesearchaeota archaeon]
MLNSRNGNKRLILNAVRSLEEDIDSIDESIYEACEALCQQLVLLLVRCGRMGGSPYRNPFIEWHDSSQTKAHLERYLEIEGKTLQKVETMLDRQDEHRRSLAELTISTPIRTHEKSDKCIIYTPQSDGKYAIARHNLYLDMTEKFDASAYEIPRLPPGFIQRYRMRMHGRIKAADVYYVENLSTKITAPDVLRHAITYLQQEYDKRKPLVAAQRDAIRPHMRYRKTDFFRQEPRKDWKEMLFAYLITSPQQA